MSKLQKVRSKVAKGASIFALALGLLAAQSANAQYTATPLTEEGAVNVITDMVTTVSNVLGATLPIVFGLVAILMGVFFVYRIARKSIGRGR